MYNIKPLFIFILLNVRKSSCLEMVLGDRCTTFKFGLLNICNFLDYGARVCKRNPNVEGSRFVMIRDVWSFLF